MLVIPHRCYMDELTSEGLFVNYYIGLFVTFYKIFFISFLKKFILKMLILIIIFGPNNELIDYVHQIICKTYDMHVVLNLQNFVEVQDSQIFLGIQHNVFLVHPWNYFVSRL